MFQKQIFPSSDAVNIIILNPGTIIINNLKFLIQPMFHIGFNKTSMETKKIVFKKIELKIISVIAVKIKKLTISLYSAVDK